MIVELLSPSTAEVDKGNKKALYEQVFRTRDYFVFDPVVADSLEGWHLNLDRGYQALAPNRQDGCGVNRSDCGWVLGRV